MSEIYSKIIELVRENNEVYKERWLKTMLKVKYIEHVVFNEASTKSNVVCFENMTK